MTPSTKKEKDLNEPFEKQFQNSVGFGEKSISSHVANPHLIFADDAHAPTAALIPVITRTMTENGCAVCAPYYIPSKSNLMSSKRLQLKAGDINPETYFVTLNSRQEGYTIP